MVTYGSLSTDSPHWVYNKGRLALEVIFATKALGDSIWTSLRKIFKIAF